MRHYKHAIHPLITTTPSLHHRHSSSCGQASTTTSQNPPLPHKQAQRHTTQTPIPCLLARVHQRFCASKNSSPAAWPFTCPPTLVSMFTANQRPRTANRNQRREELRDERRKSSPLPLDKST
ncbi:hypothetical protein M0R45_030936 [Rubus argutus]|uniref:Uncharacterized protein n=1 Tax=Rubus argutus TaxID=59490 RepID=A0AAW1WEJ6_RUBAR